MWKLSIEDDQANKTVVHLVREDYGLGRAEENAVRLTERNISRKHARLERRNDAWLLHDIRSYNGCYVNGQRVVEPQELAHGDLIQVGDYRLVVENEALLAAAENTATVPVPRLAAASASVDRLVMLVGPTPGTEFVLTPARMMVGRGEDCDISINHASVSRVHAELYPVGDGRYEILDKNSANGVRVNGVELPRSFVDARDVIELGDVILKFIPAGDTYLPGVDESLQIQAIGAVRRKEAEEILGTNLGGSSWLKWLLGGGVLLLLTVLLIAVLGRRSAPAELAGMKDEATARDEKTLDEAKQLLARGDTRGAYDRVAALPADTPARSSSEFRNIQAAYADELFTQAEKTDDISDKRSLYDQIAKSPTIDSERRSRALKRLTELSVVAVTDIPSAQEPRPAKPEPMAATTAAAQRPAPRGIETTEIAAAPSAMVRPAAAAPTHSAIRSVSSNIKPSLQRDNPY